MALRAIRAEAQGICSRSPLVEGRRVAFGKSNCRTMRFGNFCGSFLPERIFQIAASRSVSGTSQGETKSGAVIPGDMILRRKRIWSQVAATLRSPFRQKGPTSARTFHRLVRAFENAIVTDWHARLNINCHLPYDTDSYPKKHAARQHDWRKKRVEYLTA